jgi:hypothetical protein
MAALAAKGENKRREEGWGNPKLDFIHLKTL